MNKITGRFLFSLGLMLLLGYLIYESMRYNQLARLVPLVVLVPGFIAALIQFGQEVRAAFFKPEATVEKPDKEESPDEPKGREKIRLELIAIGWLLGFFFMIMLLGQLIAIPLFVLIFMRVFGKEGWRASIIFAASCWLFAYVVFIYILRNELYPGFLYLTFIK